MQGCEGRKVARALAPPRFGTPPQRAQTRAGRIEQDAVETLPGIREPACVADDDLGGIRPREGCERCAHQPRSGGDDLVRDEARAALCGLRGEHGGLPTRARTQIEPPLPRHHGACTREGECGQLGALVLHTHDPLRDLGMRGRIAARRPKGDRREPSGEEAAGLLERRRIRAPGKRRERHARCDVVGREQVAQLRLRALLRERRSECGHDPLRMGELDGEPRVARQPLERPHPPDLGLLA
ncbi:hypothetical protein GCM10025869_30540 [Homoserinibacter gongjuensis]|uniref:Uncharacterized protein n=1 Tax=Homoserinibacter gongjuensis TaxID=1162968 RepID=A0ABQ6JZ09_9MICO|nr:hypothetical protein GCM10025869_30540 [Homoserinibacter gongjuensis]